MRAAMETFGFWLSRAFATTKPRRRTWPHVPGSYFVTDPHAPVAVTTLGSVALAETVSRDAPAGLCIVGKVETENIGIEKIVKNVVSNPAIRYLVCAGHAPACLGRASVGAPPPSARVVGREWSVLPPPHRALSRMPMVVPFCSTEAATGESSPNVRRQAGQVRIVGHGDAHLGPGQRRCIVDAVADEGDARALGLHLRSAGGSDRLARRLPRGGGRRIGRRRSLFARG